MLIEYSKRAPLCQAIAQTFDGAHPCSLCHIVATGKASEKKTEIQSPVPKIDIICVARVIQLISPVALFDYTLRDFSVSEIELFPAGSTATRNGRLVRRIRCSANTVAASL